MKVFLYRKTYVHIYKSSDNKSLETPYWLTNTKYSRFYLYMYIPKQISNEWKWKKRVSDCWCSECQMWALGVRMCEWLSVYVNFEAWNVCPPELATMLGVSSIMDWVASNGWMSEWMSVGWGVAKGLYGCIWRLWHSLVPALFISNSLARLKRQKQIHLLVLKFMDRQSGWQTVQQIWL